MLFVNIIGSILFVSIVVSAMLHESPTPSIRSRKTSPSQNSTPRLKSRRSSAFPTAGYSRSARRRTSRRFSGWETHTGASHISKKPWLLFNRMNLSMNQQSNSISPFMRFIQTLRVYPDLKLKFGHSICLYIKKMSRLAVF